MNKNTCTISRLGKGEMAVYDFGALKLHAYRTNDPIDDEVFLIEKEGKAVVLESPCFFDNCRELEAYIAQKGLKPAGLLLAYHMAGASFLPGVPRYATKNADEYGHSGGGRRSSTPSPPPSEAPLTPPSTRSLTSSNPAN